jgi:ubiquinone/menaquinone biosynthesis C-methylase UbiE
METPWILDEMAYAGPEHLAPSFVAGFERKQGYGRPGGPDPGEDVAALRAHGLTEDATVLDIGAGTGRFTLAAARAFRRVIAVDISPAMLEVVRERAADECVPNIVVVQAGFLSYEHDGPPADAVHTRNALHQLPDFWKAVALDRIARLLRPGGLLRLRDMIYDFHPSEAATVFARWFADAADDPAEGYTAADYAEHIRTEYSTFRWLMEPMLHTAGFDILTADFHRRLYGAYTCVRR